MLDSVWESHNFVEPKQVGVLILADSIYCGVSLTDIQLPEKCSLQGLVRDNEFISVKDNPSIYPGDYLLAIAIYPMMLPALKVTLKKTHPVYYSFNDCLLKKKKEIINYLN